MNKLLNFILKNKFNILVLAFYIFIVVFTAFHHEMWRDEARVWYLLKNPDLFSLCKSIVMDGHPFLWYLVLYPFYLLKFNICSMQFVSAFACITAAAILLFRSPFNNFVKILFLFSAGMVYYIPVISRSYCLIPLLIFLLACFYPERIQKPYRYLAVLILLSQTHSLIWGFCIMASCIFLFELFQDFLQTKNRSKFSIVLGILIPYFTVNFFIYLYVIKHNNWVGDISGSLFNISDSHLIIFDGIMQILSQEGLRYSLRYLTFSFFFLILFILLLQNKKLFLILLASLLHILYISVNVWCDGVIYQKFFILILILIFCYWVCYASDSNKFKFYNSVMTVFLIFLFVSPKFLSVVFDDIRNSFTNTEEICNYIKDDKDSYVFLFTNSSATADNFNAHLNFPIAYSQLNNENEIEQELLNLLYLYIPKYIVIGDEESNFEPAYPYVKVMSPPASDRKIHYYNTREYYSLYENQEL